MIFLMDTYHIIDYRKNLNYNLLGVTIRFLIEINCIIVLNNKTKNSIIF